MKKAIGFKTKGMNRDLSVSAFNPEFSFENRNLRLSTNEGNTLMSWVNEKGTAQLSLTIDVDPWVSADAEDKQKATTSISGTPLGTAIIDHNLVVFTHDDSLGDFIYLLWYNKDRTEMNGKVLFDGKNLNFNLEYPLETIVSYETNYIKKVYWTDGLNQPRMINIMATDETLKKWHDDSSEVCTFFDFLPSVNSNATMTIEKKEDGGGIFAPGVIQYAFTYINKYGQQSNIIDVSPLQYLITGDRGGNPEEKVGASFVITLGNEDNKLDETFDYVRLYSIQRTSLNATPIVKLLDDIAISDVRADYSITYIDNGTTGSMMDPTELLFVGGKEISALTMIDKDNTLFLGNITEKNTLVNGVQDYFDSIRDTENAVQINFVNDEDKQSPYLDASGIYPYRNSLRESAKEVTTFKGGETYRFGFQLQKRTGEWSEPIFIDDFKNTTYPDAGFNTTKLVKAQATLDVNNFANTVEDFYKVYQKIRPVVVYPNVGDRSVLCQGVLNPTVFNTEDRISNSPFAQASWYFRPYMLTGLYGNNEAPIEKYTIETGAIPDDWETQVRPEGWFEGKTQAVYVMFAQAATKDVADRIIRQGYMGFWYNTSEGSLFDDRYAQWSFDLGYIKISDKAPYKYLFFGSTSFKYTVRTNDLNAMIGEYVTYNLTETVTYQLYNRMKKTGTRELYYMKLNDEEGTPESYTFKCACQIVTNLDSFRTENTNTFITATFGAQGTEDTSGTFVSSEGSGLIFGHYASLFTQDNIEWTDKNRFSAKQIEIQGSRKKFNNAFAEPNESVQSNTQFLVDQSILTLNSPDIEFDTEVQTSAVSGMKLRIIGMIPITATASAHNINATASLPINYNNGEAGGFGSREANYNILYENLSQDGGKRLVADYLWSDVSVWNDEGTIKAGSVFNYLIHPWHRSDSLTNDPRGGSEANAHLNTKKESNLLFSMGTRYIPEDQRLEYSHLNVQIDLTENEQVHNLRLDKQKENSWGINYYPNIDKVLSNETGYMPLVDIGTTSDGRTKTTNSPIQMKYKSTSHAVIAMKASANTSGNIPIMPYFKYTKQTEQGPQEVHVGEYTNDATGDTFWGDTGVFFHQDHIEEFGDYTPYNFLWLAELYRDIDDTTRFGGKGVNALKFNQWLPGGEAVSFDSQHSQVTLNWTRGDTYYQRYDCLKTYPFTKEDPNQIIEILSFMCETHVNIDGRYDKNRGQTNNVNMSPQNFNLLNPVYSQQDNFFSSRKADTADYKELSYPNQITWSKTKNSGADVDLWTNITMASVLELDGDKGSINKLARLNDQIWAFQDSGISQVLYNENVQVSTESGVPIEIANSGKVQGKRYLTNTVGCSNKWSVVQTPVGIYFMDSNDKSIYRMGGDGLQNISQQAGFNTWCKQNIPAMGTKWTPDEFKNFVSYYDKQNQDVLFINETEALAYSEKFGVFTSFYDYGKASYLMSLDDTGIWITGNSKLWKHRAGNYCNFFGVNKPYSMMLVGNPEPTIDKIFTNLEFRASVEGDGELDDETGKFTPALPFDSLETWNEYQHGLAKLDIKNGHAAMKHHTLDNEASLKRKFRIWRCDIPRDNAPLSGDAALGVSRVKAHPIDRMRNPWLYLKLQKDADTDKKVEIHDIVMTYFT